jgi:4-hydroxy-4-methyl-2-oxoglutarate aldolase
VTIGNVTVMPGDVVNGDRDGVVVVPRANLAAALDASEAREDKDARTIAALKSGKTTIELYGWAPLPKGQ